MKKTIFMICFLAVSLAAIAQADSTTTERMTTTLFGHPFNTQYLLIALGAVLYFAMEFKTRTSDASFSWATWWKNNWYNLIIMGACIIVYQVMFPVITNLEAFALGLLPNKAVDWVQGFMQKKNS